jgi:endogenous inhibitor of DNA gyrase (YacG/DUF329 family)
MTNQNKRSDLEARIVPCPTCRGDSLFDSSNASRPFCSARCKNMDLGAWANEEFRVESKNTESSDALDGESFAMDLAQQTSSDRNY